jgi:hypothetical protein
MLLAFNKPYGVLSRFTPDGSPHRGGRMAAGWVKDRIRVTAYRRIGVQMLNAERHADTPTRRYADTPLRPYADTPTRRHV